MADTKQDSILEKDVEIQASVNDQPGAAVGQFDPKVVKSLKRKADFVLLPILAIAYLFNSLDRSNLSNANTAGLEADLGLVGNQFNQVLTFLQVPFIVFGPVVAMITRWVGAKYTVSGMLFVFGIASLATTWARNFQTLVVCRVFVGTFESGFLASVVYYLSTWYTRTELASRIGIFYGALVASSAFGGLLSYGMFQVTPTPGYFRWSYLFILEGGLTIIWAFVVFFTIPVDIRSAWFLNETEKEVARDRVQHDSVESLETKFSWKEAVLELTSPHAWMQFLITFIGGVILTSNSHFLAMIVKRLGLSVIQTNLHTVGPALVGAVTLVMWCKSSDYFKERGYHLGSSLIISLVGYVLLYTIDSTNTAVLYFAIFLCTMGAYPNTPIGSAWLVANIPNLNARALTGGLYVSIGNCAGLVSSNIYLTNEAPRYVTSLNVNLAMCIVGFLITAAYSSWMRWENKRRDRVFGPVDGSTSGIMSTRDPRFRFMA